MRTAKIGTYIDLMVRSSNKQPGHKIRTSRNVTLYVHFRDCFNQVMKTNWSAFWEIQNIRCHSQRVLWNSVSDGQLTKYRNTVNWCAIFSTMFAHNLIIKTTDKFLESQPWGHLLTYWSFLVRHDAGIDRNGLDNAKHSNFCCSFFNGRSFETQQTGSDGKLM